MCSSVDGVAGVTVSPIRSRTQGTRAEVAAELKGWRSRVKGKRLSWDSVTVH